MVNVFVTTELWPLTNGGIGRMNYNTYCSMTEEERESTIFVIVDPQFRDGFSAQSEFYPNLMVVNSAADDSTTSSKIVSTIERDAFSGNIWLYRSYLVYCKLATIQLESKIDYIEFQDWGALAFVTLQARMSKFAFNCPIHIRLHTCHGVLSVVEGYNYSQFDRLLVDLERKAIRDADYLIVQSKPAAEQMRRMLEIPEEEWNQKVIYHVPPVTIDTDPIANESITPRFTTEIVFGSKLQKIKNPEQFIRGVELFLQRASQFEGDIVFAAHAFDGVYQESVLSLINNRHRRRYRTLGAREDRNALIGRSVFIVSSHFESFCLAAFEASLSGAVVVLNAANPAFGPGTPWLDDVNCIKYDGTDEGLAAALARIFDGRTNLPLQVVGFETPVVPWKKRRPRKLGKSRSDSQRVGKESQSDPLVSVVISFKDLGAHVLETLISVSDQTYDNIEVVIVDDASAQLSSKAILREVERLGLSAVKIIRNQVNYGLSRSRNIGIDAAAGEYILVLDGDDVIRNDFIELGVNALENSTNHSIFTSVAGYFEDSPVDNFEQIKFNGNFFMPLGEAKLSGISENKFATACALFRRSVFDDYRYEGSMHGYEDWLLYLTLVDAGFRFVLLPEAAFGYRVRKGSMVGAANDAKTRELWMKNLYRLAPSCGGGTISFLRFGDVAEKKFVTSLKERADEEHKREREYDAGYSWHLAEMLRNVVSAAVKSNAGDADSATLALIELTGFFDPLWYKSVYSDVSSLDNAWDHFKQIGLREGRSPNGRFIPHLYRACNSDVPDSDYEAIVHFMLYGSWERRRLS